MLRFFRFCCLFLALAGSTWAQQAASSIPVEWSVQITGDTLIVNAKTAAPMPSQRLNGSPTYLEVLFPKAKMISEAQSRAIDRGLVQRVQTVQDGPNTSVRVYILSKPKAVLSKTADGYRYSVRMSELAGNTSAAVPNEPVAIAPHPPVIVPKAPAAAPTPPVVVPKPPAAATAPPVAAAPKPPAATPNIPAAAPTPPVAAPKPPVAAPTPPVAATRPPAVQPQPPATPTRPPTVQPNPPAATQAPAAPAASVPSGVSMEQPITIVFQNKPIAEALQELARLAGTTAMVDPSLSGVVNLSLSQVPLENALVLLLEPYGNSIDTRVSPQGIVVRRVASAVPATPSTSAPADNIVSEYYPFSNKDAQKMMDAASKAVPELTYRVDPTLNVLLVQGPREHVIRLGELLKKMSSK